MNVGQIAPCWQSRTKLANEPLFILDSANIDNIIYLSCFLVVFMFSIALTIVVTNEKGVDSSYPTRKLCTHTCPENIFGPTLSADKDLCLVLIRGHSTTTWTEFCHL